MIANNATDSFNELCVVLYYPHSFTLSLCWYHLHFFGRHEYSRKEVSITARRGLTWLVTLRAHRLSRKDASWEMFQRKFMIIFRYLTARMWRAWKVAGLVSHFNFPFISSRI